MFDMRLSLELNLLTYGRREAGMETNKSVDRALVALRRGPSTVNKKMKKVKHLKKL
jgi:hypothetical protein